MYSVDSRTSILAAKWLPFQTWFFTDTYDTHLVERTNGHLIQTKCSDNHSRIALGSTYFLLEVIFFSTQMHAPSTKIFKGPPLGLRANHLPYIFGH